MKIQVGDIVLFAWPSGFFNWAVRTYNRLNGATDEECKYTHVGIVVNVTDEAIQIAEAIGGRGLSFYDYGLAWAGEAIENGTIKIGRSKLNLKNVLECASEYLGKGYGYLDILWIALAFLPLGTRLFSGARRVICSEFVSRVLYDASDKKLVLGYDGVDDNSEFNKRFDLITPFDLLRSKQIDWNVK